MMNSNPTLPCRAFTVLAYAEKILDLNHFSSHHQPHPSFLPAFTMAVSPGSQHALLLDSFPSLQILCPSMGSNVLTVL